MSRPAPHNNTLYLDWPSMCDGQSFFRHSQASVENFSGLLSRNCSGPNRCVSRNELMILSSALFPDTEQETRRIRTMFAPIDGRLRSSEVWVKVQLQAASSSLIAAAVRWPSPEEESGKRCHSYLDYAASDIGLSPDGLERSRAQSKVRAHCRRSYGS